MPNSILLIATIPIFNLKKSTLLSFVKRNLLYLTLLLLILCIPIGLNYYSPSWNLFLKSIPFIKNSSTLIRWFSLYIPIVITLSCVSLKHIKWVQNREKITALLAIALVIFLSSFMLNKNHYHSESYNPHAIITNYESLKSNSFTPEIKSIETRMLMNGKLITGNDLMITGSSPLKPYEPMFGYWLEKFPVKTLHQGSVVQEDSVGNLNFKNPVSYVFPKENNLSPGDHFTIHQKESVEKITNYLNYPFEMPTRQKWANHITLISLTLLATYLLWLVVSIFYRMIKRTE